MAGVSKNGRPSLDLSAMPDSLHPKGANPPRSPFNLHIPCPPGSPKSPVCKTKSAGLDRVKPRVTMDRFLSVEHSDIPTTGGRRSGGSGLQKLSGSTPQIPTETHKPKGKGLFINLLQPINTYVRRRSMSRESSSSDTDSDDSRSRSVSGGSRRNSSVDRRRRGSNNTILSKLSGKERRNSDNDIAPSVSNNKHKEKKSFMFSSNSRRNSLEVLKDRKAADKIKELKTRKPEKIFVDQSQTAVRKDSITALRLKKSKTNKEKKKASGDRKLSKEKLSKKRSLGETLSLKYPMDVIRRNSMDAFSLKNLFSLSQKNSVEDVRGPSKENSKRKSQTDKLLNVARANLGRSNSNDGDDVHSDSPAYVYKPMQRQRMRLGSYGLASSLDSSTSKPSASATRNAYSSDRRSSGPSVVVYPPSSASSSHHSGSNATSNDDDSDHSVSLSHSSITSLDTDERSISSSSNESDDRRNPGSKDRHHRRKKVVQRPKSDRVSTGSRPSSTTDDDVFDSSSSSEAAENGNRPRQGGDFWASLQAAPPPLNVVAASEEDSYNLYDDYIFQGTN